MSEPDCPVCHTAMRRARGASGLRFQCPTCSGVILGLGVFRQVLPSGVGAHVWVAAAATPADGAPCGFCSRPMRPSAVAADGGPPAKVGVCRVCEAVWIPADQAALLPLPGAHGGGLAEPLAPPPPARCPECGAPFQVGADGCCPFCHRRVEAPEPGLGLQAAEARGLDLSSLGARVVEGAAMAALGFLLGQ